MYCVNLVMVKDAGLSALETEVFYPGTAHSAAVETFPTDQPMCFNPEMKLFK